MEGVMHYDLTDEANKVAREIEKLDVRVFESLTETEWKRFDALIEQRRKMLLDRTWYKCHAEAKKALTPNSIDFMY